MGHGGLREIQEIEESIKDFTNINSLEQYAHILYLGQEDTVLDESGNDTNVVVQDG